MRDDELLTVSELAERSGVTVRTLHHYDEIGLLVPTARSRAGYRLYGRDDVERLARIVAYRATGLSLRDIATALSVEGLDRSAHLRRQIELIDRQAKDLSRQRDLLVRALEREGNAVSMDPEEIIEVFGDFDPREYEDEVVERWGDTDAYTESRRRTSAYTKDDWARINAEQEATEAAFAQCLASGEPADSAQAAEVAEAHRMHIDRWYYPCTYEMQVGLADMYVADPRFAAHYDHRAPGLAQYVCDAILANAVRRMA